MHCRWRPWTVDRGVPLIIFRNGQRCLVLEMGQADPEPMHSYWIASLIEKKKKSVVNKCKFVQMLFEPRSEKTGLRGFRPGPT